MKRHIGKLVLLLLVFTLALPFGAFASDAKTLADPEAAVQVALKDAEISPDDAIIMSIELKWDYGNLMYWIEFYAADIQYEYGVTPYSLSVLGYNMEYKPAAYTKDSFADVIGRDKAQALAFESAKVDPAAAVLIKVELDDENGAWQYEVEFSLGDQEYEYKLDAKTGVVLSNKQETNNRFNTERLMLETEPLPGGNVDGDQALAIALKHAKVTEDQLTEYSVMYNDEKGAPQYDIEFKAGAMEYEYQIDTLKGMILKSKVEADD